MQKFNALQLRTTMRKPSWLTNTCSAVSKHSLIRSQYVSIEFY